MSQQQNPHDPGREAKEFPPSPTRRTSQRIYRTVFAVQRRKISKQPRKKTLQRKPPSTIDSTCSAHSLRRETRSKTIQVVNICKNGRREEKGFTIFNTKGWRYIYPINIQVNGEEDGAAFILMVSLKMARVYNLHHYAASTPSDGD